MLPPVIVLEGPDCGGKTTLANWLVKNHDCQLVHTGPPQGLPFQEYMSQLMDVDLKRRMGMDTRPVVFDRLHLGERVYGPIVRDNDRLGPYYNRMLDRVLLGFGAVIVYCAPCDRQLTVDEWRKRAAEGKELITNEGLFEKVLQEYQSLMVKQIVSLAMYDYTAPNAELNLIERVQTYGAFPNEGPGIGHWSPGKSTLLVGEQIAKPISGKVDWPFTGVGGSSLWLAERLEEWGVSERDLYWVNALRPANQKADPEFIARLRPKKVIALGVMADNWLDEAGIAHEKVDHPQSWKRFNYGKPYPLREHLT